MDYRDVEVRSNAATPEERQRDVEQQQPRALEGLSGMVPGTQRRDNLDSRPDFYTEFGDTSAATTEVMNPRNYPDGEGMEEERAEDRDLTDLGRPSEDKGHDR